ncbi:biopolymer transporter ExbD [Comamonas serinivorans]|uniref:Biopolymer transporter ExbD n=1 Tax=Comamonas serinivorans TaxID=1082851 RepID=A0A1Y0ENS9_9BURK|nr:biopolymer transporter ExbD [Comamonas serinivorans]ARU05108.1 biopolymer transporter ExbD [Comamonas serinivorans]
MNFRHGSREEPEINLIPFIDVLLVILIFLMLTTTYNKFTELQLTLPTADTEAMKDRPREIIVTVGADGRYMVNKQVLQGRSATELGSALAIAHQALGAGKPPVLIISADAQTPHQAVVTVMEAARSRGLSQITFASQASGRAR